MQDIFSIPTYPGATSYAVQYSDPTSANPNAPNPLGPWTNVTGSPFTYTSNIIDNGSQNLRLYRAAPTVNVSVNGTQTSFTFPYYRPFSVAMSDPGVFTSRLYDPNITMMVSAFRNFIGDNGVLQTASTDLNLDSGAGEGLLQPDGQTTVFNLADMPDAVPDVTLEGSVSVTKNNLALIENTDYWVNYEAGQVIFATPPLSSDSIHINFQEVTYTNCTLNAALANAIDRLQALGINGYGITYDNNVSLVAAKVANQQGYVGIGTTGGLSPGGLRFIIFSIAQKIINQIVIWKKAAQARQYKIDNFSMDTAPARLIEGMSGQSKIDFEELKDSVDKYIRSATFPIVYGDYDAFFDTNGLLPSWSAVFLLNPYAYWV